MSGVAPGGPLVPWWRRADWGALLVVVVVLLSSATGLGNGFAYDDVPIVRDNPAVHAWRWPWAFLGETYWSPPFGEALYRPLTIGLFSVQWMVGGGSAAVFHVVNVVVYAVCAVLLLRLARALMSPWVAVAVALLWAAHPVHVEVVGNIVGQSELWVALASLTALLAVQRLTTDGRVTVARTITIWGAVLVGLGAKENGVVLPAFVGGMLTHWLVVGSAPVAGRARAWIVARGSLYALAAYLVARYAVLGTLGGDGSHLVLAELPTVERLLAAIAFRVTEARLLLVGGPLAADYGPPVHPLHRTPDAYHLAAALLLVAWVLLGRRLHRERRPSWPVVWVPLAIAPTANIFFTSGIIMSERSLFLPSLGVCLSAGLAADMMIAQARTAVGRTVRVAVRLAFVAVVLAWVSASARRQLVWRDSHSLAASSLLEAPASPAWQRVLGTVFLRAHEFDRAEAHLRIAERLGPPDPRLLGAMATALERQGRCEESLQYLRRMIAMYERSPFDELAFISCLLRVGRYREARSTALGASVEFPVPEPFLMLRQLAESALVASDSVWSPAARTPARPALPIAGEVLAVRIDDRGRLVRFRLPSAPPE